MSILLESLYLWCNRGKRAVPLPGVFALAVLLASCGATNHLSNRVRNDLRIGKISVLVGKEAWGLKNALPPDALKQNLSRAIREKTAVFQGHSTVDIRISISNYYIPSVAASVLIGMTPYIGSTITLVDARTGKPVGEPQNFNISVNDFDGGNWAVASPYKTKFDRKYPMMIGLYARKLTKWLGKSHGH